MNRNVAFTLSVSGLQDVPGAPGSQATGHFVAHRLHALGPAINEPFFPIA